MQRKTASRVVGFALCGGLFLGLAATRGNWQGAAGEPPAAAKAAAGEFVVAPYLQFATETGITVMAETATPMAATVRYGLTGETDQSAAGEPGAMHEVRLEGLQADTKYFYRVECAAQPGGPVVLTSDLLTFTTASDAARAYSFAVIGDTQRNPTVTGRVAKLIGDRRPNFVLHMGDTVNDGPEKWQWTGDLLKPCAGLFGRVPVYPCLGNHERNHAYYYRYFSLPAPEYYYQFRYGSAEFFVLDTNKSVAAGTEQHAWLDRALGASKATWKVVYHHHPVYSSDSDDYGDTYKGAKRRDQGDPNVRHLAALYERHGVDLAMNGHIHLYERTWPLKGGKVDLAGVVYLTSGGGGGSLENFDPAATFFKNQGRVAYHYVYFTAFGGRLEGKAFDDQDRLFDSFELRK